MTDRTTNWKIRTLNIKGINKDEKFDDMLEWINQERLDITIITETKLHPSNAYHNFISKNKKYISYWTIDSLHTKGSGVGIIINKNTLGKHVYSHLDIPGRLLQVRLKFKGKITVVITGIYGPADKSDKKTKNAIIGQIKNHIKNEQNCYHIIAGDLNEDPDNHSTHTMIDTILGLGLFKLTTYDAPTWSNSGGIERQLDHVFVSEGLATGDYTTDTINLHQIIETDYKAVVTFFKAIHILASQTQAKRRLRNKDNHTEEILDLKHCSEEVWEYFKETLDQDFIDPFEENHVDDVDHTYGKIIDQVVKAARSTLRWKHTNQEQLQKYTKTEVIIHKARKLVGEYKKAYLSQESTTRQFELIKKLSNLLPNVPWLNNHNFNTVDFYLLFKHTWDTEKQRLYAVKRKEALNSIIELVKQRENNYKNNKGAMLSSTLNRRHKRIDTSQIIYEGDYIDELLAVKEAISDSAKKWTRKIIITTNSAHWNREYEPLQSIRDDTFDPVSAEITIGEVVGAINSFPNNKAAGPSKMTYECWKESPEVVLIAITKLFNQIITLGRMPKEWKRANIIPIPKATDWGMDIDKTRPITLLETLRKIFTKILTNRIEEICRKSDILKGNNCSVLKGTSTHCLINIIKNLLEDVNTSQNGELWLVLQDMRKAFDSVGWSLVIRAKP